MRNDVLLDTLMRRERMFARELDEVLDTFGVQVTESNGYITFKTAKMSVTIAPHVSPTEIRNELIAFLLSIPSWFDFACYKYLRDKEEKRKEECLKNKQKGGRV